MPKILAFAGSTRPGSLNQKLVSLVASRLKAHGAEVTEISLKDYPLPFVDGTGFGGAPKEAHALRDVINAHDGMFLAVPEYNGGYAPLIKNALDWASIAPPGAPATGLANKVVAIGGASPGAMGGYRGLTQFRTMLELGMGALLVPEMVAVGGGDDAWNADGSLKDERTAGYLEQMVTRLVKLTS